MHPPKWVSIECAAEKFTVSRDTIRRMIRRGEITAVRIGPRVIRVDLNSIQVSPVSGGAA